MNFRANIVNKFLSLSLLPFLSSSTLLYNNHIAQAQGTNIPFDVCFDLDSFVRPNISEQIALMKKRANGGRSSVSNLADSILWTGNVFVYNEYQGISGTGDHLIFQGLWSMIRDNESLGEKMSQCAFKLSDTNTFYTSGKTNSKTEIRLFKHKLKQIKWVNNKYIMTVEPSQSGLQISHYNKTRQHLASKNPVLIEVVDTNGKKIGSCREIFSCMF
ncbi:MAG TPA: hypothetical protein DCF68_03795 [Cyanothece sp. UBA12306]|nr:hypothetical protein [Cyanothece sp. UBA12306]